MTTPSALPLTCSEAQLQEVVITYAQLRGWMVAHFRPGRNARGKYLTAMTGDTGYPDLTFAREGAVVFIELKRHGGKASPNQERWNENLPHAYIFDTNDWNSGKIMEVLR